MAGRDVVAVAAAAVDTDVLLRGGAVGLERHAVAPLEHGGGTVVLSERGTMFGPGGPSISGGFLAHHFYDGTANGDFRLGVRRIAWSEDGWPILANPVSPTP